MLWKNRFRQGWSVGIMSLAILACVRPAFAAGEHYVFAHYMVCYATYGDNLEGFKREIKEAQAAGIDGFALNCGEWDAPGSAWFFTNRTEMLYQAAEQLGTGFKFFFSVDTINLTDIVDMISSHANRSNSFRYNGKLVVSTSGQSNVDWERSVFQPLASKGVNVFFVPYFLPDNGNIGSASSVSNMLLNCDSFVDGLYYFAAGTPADITNRNQAYSDTCKDFNKIFMGGCSPSYWGSAWPANTGRPYYETQGGEGASAQWEWIIKNQPDWVEISTWNDFNESTYIAPVENPELYENQLAQLHRNCHSGYLELYKYYINWYKTGQEPGINQDALFYFYRTHSTNAVASNSIDCPVVLFANNGKTEDVIYTTTFLTSPAQLIIKTGSTLSTNLLPAGISNIRTPFSAGVQSFTLRRNGLQVMTVQGTENILGNIQNYNYFTTSGYIYRPQLKSPVNLIANGQ